MVSVDTRGGGDPPAVREQGQLYTESTCVTWAADKSSCWLDYQAGEFILNQDTLRVACWAPSEPLGRHKCEFCVCVCSLQEISTCRGGEILWTAQGPNLGSLSHRIHEFVLQHNKFSKLGLLNETCSVLEGLPVFITSFKKRHNVIKCFCEIVITC